mmetsp:Transcript_67493/g.158949  ORF Transcript_67493/g.158949 Transcript_67493/m.158949 type:complete len:313 (+) Transcript_67493:372-1310(+)
MLCMPPKSSSLPIHNPQGSPAALDTPRSHCHRPRSQLPRFRLRLCCGIACEDLSHTWLCRAATPPSPAIYSPLGRGAPRTPECQRQSLRRLSRHSRRPCVRGGYASAGLCRSLRCTAPRRANLHTHSRPGKQPCRSRGLASYLQCSPCHHTSSRSSPAVNVRSGLRRKCRYRRSNHSSQPTHSREGKQASCNTSSRRGGPRSCTLCLHDELQRPLPDSSPQCLVHKKRCIASSPTTRPTRSPPGIPQSCKCSPPPPRPRKASLRRCPQLAQFWYAWRSPGHNSPSILATHSNHSIRNRLGRRLPDCRAATRR